MRSAATNAVLPVVLVHGLVGPFADHRAVALLRPAAVLSPDLLGYGAVGDPSVIRITIERQAEALLASIDQAGFDTRVHLAGHSVGWVIAACFALAHSDRVASLTNVEGNFTLADAFWSSRLAQMDLARVQELLDTDRADPERWLTKAGVTVTPDRIRLAAEALAYQPASTLQSMARAVVNYTARPQYERDLRQVFDGTPVHLVAGARSRRDWDLPEWALSAAASYREVPDAGHMVMLEAPGAFGEVLRDVVVENRQPGREV